jgi:hypothetical protein
MMTMEVRADLFPFIARQVLTAKQNYAAAPDNFRFRLARLSDFCDTPFRTAVLS